MPDKQFATLTTEVKAAAEADDRTLRFIGTTAARDRMGDEITLSGWDFKNYKRNPVVLWAHDYAGLPIGKTTRIAKEDIGGGQKGWAFDVKFAPGDANPRAEQCYQLAKGGFLNAVSVGFQSHKSEWIAEDDEAKEQRNKDTPDKHPGKRFLKKELLELSIAPVPAHPEALQVARKKGMSLPKELNAALDSLALERASEALANTRQIKAQLAALGGNTETATSGYVHVEGTPILPPCETVVSVGNAATVQQPHIQSATSGYVHTEGPLPVNQPGKWYFPPDEKADIPTVTKPGWDDDAEKKEIAYRVREPGKFKDDSLKRLTLQKQKPRVHAIVGQLKGQDSMTIQALRFPREDGWDKKKAQAWLKKHPDVVKIIDETACELEITGPDIMQAAAMNVVSGIERDLLEEDTRIDAVKATGGIVDIKINALPDKNELVAMLEANKDEIAKIIEHEYLTNQKFRSILRDEADDVALPDGENAEPAMPDSDEKVDDASTPTDTPALPPEENADNASDAGGPEYIRFAPEDPEETLTILEG